MLHPFAYQATRLRARRWRECVRPRDGLCKCRACVEPDSNVPIEPGDTESAHARAPSAGAALVLGVDVVRTVAGDLHVVACCAGRLLDVVRI